MPQYFVAVFGDPLPNKDAVESGVYTPDPKYAPFPVSPDDVMLLYCTGAYAAHPKQVPGYGMVLGADREHIHYRWEPFAKPISKTVMNKLFNPEDAKKFGLIRFSSHWLFKISDESFSRAVGDRPTA